MYRKANYHNYVKLDKDLVGQYPVQSEARQSKLSKLLMMKKEKLR